MKKDRKNIILQSLASMLEERNLTKITTALLAEKSNITEAALYRHFPSKRSIYAELFSFCDDAVFNKCNELKKSKLSGKDKAKNAYMFFMMFICVLCTNNHLRYFGLVYIPDTIANPHDCTYWYNKYIS